MSLQPPTLHTGFAHTLHHTAPVHQARGQTSVAKKHAPALGRQPSGAQAGRRQSNHSQCNDMLPPTWHRDEPEPHHYFVPGYGLASGMTRWSFHVFYFSRFRFSSAVIVVENSIKDSSPGYDPSSRRGMEARPRRPPLLPRPGPTPRRERRPFDALTTRPLSSWSQGGDRTISGSLLARQSDGAGQHSSDPTHSAIPR